MFERFTERARQVVVLAQESARDRSGHVIGTMEILYGLVAEEEGLASRVLASFDIDKEKISAALPSFEIDQDLPQQIPFTKTAKHHLELALREALSLGHNYIGTEHILLGLVRETPNNDAADWLTRQGGTRDEVTKKVISLLRGPGTSVEQAYSADSPEEQSDLDVILEGLKNLTLRMEDEARILATYGGETGKAVAQSLEDTNDSIESILEKARLN